MSVKPSLSTLLDFAQKESDISAKKLGQLASQQQEATEKLHLLLEYRHSYQSRFQDATKNGIDHIEWLNFITFMDKLDAAITEQRNSVSTAQANGKQVERNSKPANSNLNHTTPCQNDI